jgi:hypothetical protein
MHKFFFCLLLVVNAVLYAFGQGYLGHFSGSEHEPERLRNQLNQNKLSLIAPPPASSTPTSAAAVSTADASAPATATAPAPTAPAVAAAAAPAAALAPAPAARAVPALACAEIGNFSATESRRFEAQLAALELDDFATKRPAANQEVSSYIVYIPPQPNADGTAKRAAELKQLGITDFFVIPENSAMHGAISLGVFKSEAAAQTQLANLVKQGVHAARVGPRYAGGKQLAFQLRGLDSAAKGRFDRIRAQFPEQDARACR